MFYQYCVFIEKLLQQIVSICISLIFTYCLYIYVERKLGDDWNLLLNFFGVGVKKSRKGPILEPQMRAKDTFSWWSFRDSIWNIAALKFNKKWEKSVEYFLVNTKYR